MKTKIDTIRNDLPFTLDLREQSSIEYLESKGYSVLGKIPYYVAISGIICFAISVFIGISKVGAYNYEDYTFINRFPLENTVIGCYNDRTEETRISKTCTLPGDHNIILPSQDQIEIWLKYFNHFEIINRLALVNFESSFNENSGNRYAKGYVQTLRKYNVPNDIDSQLMWLKKRQSEQSKVMVGNSRRCGYYWNNYNLKDKQPQGEYGVLACLYRYHYHAYKGTWYSKRGIIATKFYKEYLFGIK